MRLFTESTYDEAALRIYHRPSRANGTPSRSHPPPISIHTATPFARKVPSIQHEEGRGRGAGRHLRSKVGSCKYLHAMNKKRRGSRVPVKGFALFRLGRRAGLYGVRTPLPVMPLEPLDFRQVPLPCGTRVVHKYEQTFFYQPFIHL